MKEEDFATQEQIGTLKELNLTDSDTLTLAEAQKLIRQTGVEVEICAVFEKGSRIGYDYDIFTDFSGVSSYSGKRPFYESYEKALSTGISIALDYLKKEFKNI